MATYTVEPNDNLSLIANKLGISLNALKEANPAVLPPEFKIRVGDQLALPNGIKNSVQSNTKETRNPQRSNTDANKANNAAKADFLPREAGISNCPNQKEWITVVPLRYGVQQKSNEAFEQQLLKIGNMPTLKNHNYVTRPLMSCYVYMYSNKDQHLTEVEYGPDGSAMQGQCICGSSPGEASGALPTLKAQKDDTLEFLISQGKLTSQLAAAFSNDKTLRKKFFQTISVANARAKGTTNARPLIDLPKFFADSNVKSHLFDWSIQPVNSDLKDQLIGSANAATPDNHIAVVIPDPINISTELALLFEAQYDTAMQSIAQTQHPYLVGKATEQLLTKLTQKDYDQKVLNYSVKAERQPSPQQGRIFNPQNVKLSWPLHPLYGYDLYVTPLSQNEIDAIKEKNRNRAKKDYLEHIHHAPMQDYMRDRDEYIASLPKALDEEASDWIKWLESDHIDRALILFSPTVEATTDREIALSNMLQNLPATDKGAKLCDEWANQLVKNLNICSKSTNSDQNEPQLAFTSGAGSHLLPTLTGNVLIEANKWNKELIAAAGIDWDSYSESYNTLITSKALKANAATDNLNMIIGERVARLGTKIENGQAFAYYFERQSFRYNYSLAMGELDIIDMVEDIKITHQTNVELATGATTTTIAVASKKTVQQSSKLKVFDTSKPVAAGKIQQTQKAVSEWFVGQADKGGMVNPKGLPAQSVRKLGESYTKFVGPGLGLLFVGQVYNFYSLSIKLSQDFSAKNVVDTGASLAGVIQTSFALIQRHFYKNTSALMEGAIHKTYENAGIRISSSIDNLRATGYGNKAVLKSLTKTVESGHKLIGISGRFAYKALPVVGNLLASVSSWLNVSKDFSTNQSAITTSVGIASGIVNTAALACAVVALINPLAPLVATFAIVLALAGLALDLWHSHLEYNQTVQFLRQTFWGKEPEYKYKRGLSSYFQRRQYYLNFKESNVSNSGKQELADFCDELFRPILSTENYSETDWNSKENFDLVIHLPGYNKQQSVLMPEFRLVALTDNSCVTLFDSQDNKMQIIAPIYSGTSEKHLTLKIDESAWDKDYDSYELELKHHNPAGYPVSLHYKVTIDDDSKIPLTDDVTYTFERIK